MMKAKVMRKGQIYSLDFLIAAGLLVLAIGMLLNFFEASAYQGKEARIKNELNAVALTASNILLAQNTCPSDFTGAPPTGQGYRAYGCYDTGGFSTATKTQLLIPSKFRCRVEVDDRLPQTPVTDCTDIAGNAPDVASVTRAFLVPQAAFNKADYEKCIAGSCQANYYSEHSITVKVWLG